MPFWLALFIAGLIPRIAAAFLLPNVDGDAYSYAEMSHRIRDSIVDGSLSAKQMLTFWLPFYPILCALAELVYDDIVLVPKLVCTFFGAAAAAASYFIAFRLTQQKLLSLAAFAAVALNPFHVFYSASSMTDIPYACGIALALAFALHGRWLLASTGIAIAASSRYEGWLFIPIILGIILFSEKKFVWKSALILALPVVLSSLIALVAVGNPIAPFALRDEYVATYYRFHPVETSLDTATVVQNIVLFVFAIHPILAVSGIAAASFAVWKRWNSEDRKPAAIAGVFFLIALTSVIASYFFGKQPVLFIRYGLCIFTIGIPIFAMGFFEVQKLVPKLRLVIWGGLAIFVAAHGVNSASIGLESIKQIEPHRKAAEFLSAEFKKNPGIIVYCDEPTVRVLSKIPEKQFRTKFISPQDRDTLIEYMRKENVAFVVYSGVEYCSLATAIPELDSGSSWKGFRAEIWNELAAVRINGSPNLWVYRFTP